MILYFLGPRKHSITGLLILNQVADPNPPTAVWYAGTKSVYDGDGLLLQGFVNAVASPEPVVFRLNNVPTGNYNLLVCSVGFDFTANFYQAYGLTGAASYPTYHGKAETGINYVGSPAFRRMTTTATTALSPGNYVQFDSVSPAVDGSLAVSATWEPPGSGHQQLPPANNQRHPIGAGESLASEFRSDGQFARHPDRLVVGDGHWIYPPVLTNFWDRSDLDRSVRHAEPYHRRGFNHRQYDNWRWRLLPVVQTMIL